MEGTSFKPAAFDDKQSQLDCGLQPKVGAPGLPWVHATHPVKPHGVFANIGCKARKAATALRLEVWV